MIVGCFGGWCLSRERCARYHSTDAPVLIERLCEAGERDAFEPIQIVKSETKTAQAEGEGDE